MHSEYFSTCRRHDSLTAGIPLAHCRHSTAFRKASVELNLSRSSANIRRPTCFAEYIAHVGKGGSHRRSRGHATVKKFDCGADHSARVKRKPNSWHTLESRTTLLEFPIINARGEKGVLGPVVTPPHYRKLLPHRCTITMIQWPFFSPPGRETRLLRTFRMLQAHARPGTYRRTATAVRSNRSNNGYRFKLCKHIPEILSAFVRSIAQRSRDNRRTKACRMLIEGDSGGSVRRVNSHGILPIER